MLTYDEIIILAAEAYHDALLANADMRKATEAIETIRSAMSEEKDEFRVWKILDEQIGKTWRPSDEPIEYEKIEMLQSFLVKMRTRFEQKIMAKGVERLHAIFKQNEDSGWAAWIRVYGEALCFRRIQFCLALVDEPFQFPSKKEIEKIRKATRLILHGRSTEAFDIFPDLANQDAITSVIRARLFAAAGEIQLYHYKHFERANELFHEATELAPEDGRVLASLGKYHLERYEIEEAKKLFTEVIKKDPELIDGYTSMGECYEKQNDLSAAEAWYKEAIRMAGGNSYGYIRLLRLLGNQEGFEINEARGLLLVKHIKAVNPLDEYSAYLEMGSNYTQNKQYRKAHQFFQKAIDLDATRVAGYISKGYAYIEEKEYNQAQSSFQEAISIAPEAFDGFFGMASLYDERKEWEQAIHWYKESLSRRPAWRTKIINKIGGIKWKYQKKYAEAEEELKETLRNDPNSEAILQTLHDLAADHYRNLDDSNAALRIYNEIRQIIGPSYEAEYQNRVGNLKYYLGKYGEALEHYQRAVASESKETILTIYYANLGNAFKNLRQLDDAERAYREVVKLDPNEANYQNILGNILYESGRFGLSVDPYIKATELAPSVAVYHANLGGAYRALGLWEQAREAYLKTVELEPGNEDYQNELGYIYYELGRFEESLPYYAKAVEINPNDAVYHANLGTSYGALGQWEEAKEAYTKAIALDPQPIYECNLGRAYGSLGQLEKMIEHCGRAVELRRKVPQDAYGLDYYYQDLAEAYFKVGRLNEFEDLFEKSGDFKEEPEKKAVVYNRIGNFFFSEYKYKETIPYYEKANKLDSHRPIYECNLGRAYGNLEQWEKMIEHCGRAVELRRKVPQDAYGLDYYYQDLAEAYFKAGRLKEFEALFEGSGDLKEEPEKKAVVYNRIGNFFFGEYKNEESIPHYMKATELAPRVAVYHANLGGAYGALGLWEQAEKSCSEAVTLDPGKAEYQNMLGNIFYESGRFGLSVDPYIKATELAPSVAVYHANLGGACRALGLWDQAREAYLRGVELEPGNGDYQNRLGLIFYILGRFEESLPYYTKAIGINSNVAVYHANLGTSYGALGRWKEAKEAYTKAVALDNQPIDECNLGRAYGNLEQWEKMIEHCGRAVELRRKVPQDAYGLDYYYGYLAEAYFKSDRLREFEALFEGSGDLKEDPEKKAVVYNRIGNLYFEALKNREAIPYYERATGLDNKMPIYESNLGLSYRDLGQWDKMIEHCGRAVELRRKTPGDFYGLDYYYEYLAEAYFKSGRLREFEALFEGSGDLKEEPEKKAVVYNRIGNFFFSEYKNDESIPYYKKATELVPHVAVYHANLGGAYRALGVWEKARGAYLRAVELEPRNADYRNRLGLIYYELKRFEESLSYYAKAIEINPDNAVFHANLGTSYEALGRWEEAKEAYTKAVELDAQPIYECNLGKAYGNLGQWEKMIEHCEKAVELRKKAPTDPDGLDYYYKFLVEAYFKAKRLRDFEILFEGSGDLKAEPEKRAIIYNRIGNLFFAAYQNQEAIPYYEKAIDLDNARPIYECNLGLTYGDLGQWGKAIEHYAKAIELRKKTPTDPYGLDYYYEYLAEAYFRVGRLKEFEELFEGSRDLQGEPEKKAIIYNRIGNLLFESKKNQESALYYTKAIDLAPKVAVYHANLGGAYRALGLWEKARGAYLRAVELEPGNADYQNRLGLMYYETGRFEESLSYYAQAMEINPNVALYYANLGTSYGALGQWEKAEEIYLRVLELEPDNPEYQDRIGFIYSQIGDYNKAAEHFMKAVALKPDSQLYISDFVKTTEKIVNPAARVSLLKSALRYAPENIELKQAIENLKR